MLEMVPMSKVKLHPVFIPGKFIVKTPMMEGLLNQIFGWISNGYTGGIVLGETRIGKSVAIEHIKSNLTNRAKEPIPVVNMTVSKRDVKTITSIFRNICYAIGKPIKSRSNSDTLANEIIHYLGELSLTNQTRQVVLIVDEMQRLSLHQFEAFAELYDKLSTIGANLMVVFVGNKSDSSPTIKSIKSEKYALISGRFFNHRTKYDGIRNVKEVRQILMQFDSHIFEENGDKTATEFF
jgi:Cdc6-like AAA superfamily ATPase